MIVPILNEVVIVDDCHFFSERQTLLRIVITSISDGRRCPDLGGAVSFIHKVLQCVIVMLHVIGDVLETAIERLVCLDRDPARPQLIDEGQFAFLVCRTEIGR